MIAESIDMLTPLNGKVLDPYDGAPTTEVKALKSSRSCVLIEKDVDCFEDAVVRLQKLVDVLF